MRLLQNNFIVLLGTFVVLCTATFRSINTDPQFLWVGSIGILFFALSVVGQIITVTARLEEMQHDLDSLRERVRNTTKS